MDSNKTEKLFEDALVVIKSVLKSGFKEYDRDIFKGAISTANMHIKIKNREMNQRQYLLTGEKFNFDIVRAIAKNKEELKELIKKHLSDRIN